MNFRLYFDDLVYQNAIAWVDRGREDKEGREGDVDLEVRVVESMKWLGDGWKGVREKWSLMLERIEE